ncbi:MAG: DMT family transporter [Pedosphaera sp.]|nr:DMT family transporter [Pedosphaera sp.]
MLAAAWKSSLEKKNYLAVVLEANLGILRPVRDRSHQISIGLGLVLAAVLWGSNNVGLRYLVQQWPPVWTGASRFLCAGMLLTAGLRFTGWLGPTTRLSRGAQIQLWFRGGFSLAAYIAVCNGSLQYIPSSHFALHLAAAPVWVLIWEGQLAPSRHSFPKMSAALLTFSGVLLLLWPAIRNGQAPWYGEALGVCAGLLWTWYTRESQVHVREMTGIEVTAATMWRAGVWLLPLAAFELSVRPIHWDLRLLLIQAYSIVFGGAAAFVLWNRALKHWPASRVFLFGNLVPVSTMVWAFVLLNEPVTPRLGWALLLILAGVWLGRRS